ncbi:hypothetical protein SCL_2733 [Sulfuricaulis limicola]|uniref:Uncharacterized protein n=2 Tax=Sulfuricaulis limicola TaxID=1620215 RepID=A0A1B4XJN0_9GAMM|nr:hypothetical protein SCL_2733 [Sulfuricaulis limicola]
MLNVTTGGLLMVTPVMDMVNAVAVDGDVTPPGGATMMVVSPEDVPGVPDSPSLPLQPARATTAKAEMKLNR